MNIYLADHAEAIIYCYTMVDVKVVLTNPLCLGAGKVVEFWELLQLSH